MENTKPAVKSKINTKSMLVVGIVFLFQMLGQDIDPNLVVEIALNIAPFILYANEIINMILRTWFSGTKIEGIFQKAEKVFNKTFLVGPVDQYGKAEVQEFESYEDAIASADFNQEFDLFDAETDELKFAYKPKR